jgi:RNA polymerase sigma factor (sigma-70 family)
MNQMHRLGSDLSALSDAELITSSRAGSDAAFAVLYSRHAGSARAAARSLGASRSDVDDLVAEAFTRVLSALQRGAGPEVAFRPYLMTCVRNAWYDKARKDGRVDVPGDVPEDINLALLNVPPDSEDARMVAAAFASLPERWQMVLWHTEVEGRPAAEVGPLLGLAPNAVAALAYRAREGLRQAYLQAHLQLPPPDACRDTITKLGAYVRDGLSARDRRKVDAHLKDCERCTAVLLELQEVSTSLRGVLLPVLLGVAGTAFLANLGGGGAAVLALLRWRPRTPATQAGVVAATAAAVVAGVVGVAAINNHGDERIAAQGAAVVTTTTVAAPKATTAAATAPPTVATTAIAATPGIAPTVPPVSVLPTQAPTSAARRATASTVETAPPRTTPRSTPTSTSPETTTPPTTAPDTEAPTVPTTAPAPLPPPALVPLSLTATPVGPAFAGLSATVNVATGVNPTVAGASLGRSLVAQADPELAGPVTIAASVPVLDWGVPGCSPGTTCLLAAPTSQLTLRLDLKAAKAGDALPISVTATADGAAPATATLDLTTTSAPAGLRYFTVDHGGLAMAANTVVTCLPEDGRCDVNNNTSELGYVDEGSIPGAIDSSLADLQLPAGATVLSATLRWGGNPAGASDDSPASLGTVTFAVPGGAPTEVHADQAPLMAPGSAYAASADVTAMIRQLPTPNGTYQVANVKTGTGPGQFGGWTLLVAYHRPEAPLQALAVFDDAGQDGKLSDMKAGVRFALPGFTTPPSVQVGVVAYEGDLGLFTDRATVGGKTLGTRDNFFRSTIDVGDAPRVPPEKNQYGFDAQLLDVTGGLKTDPDGLAVTFRTTEAEAVYMGGVAMAFPV